MDDLKVFKDYCPRNLFSGSNFSPEKSLQKNLSIFCLENQSCDRRNERLLFKLSDLTHSSRRHNSLPRSSQRCYAQTESNTRTVTDKILRVSRTILENVLCSRRVAWPVKLLRGGCRRQLADTTTPLQTHFLYNTIVVLLPCGCAWITFWKNSHCHLKQCQLWTKSIAFSHSFKGACLHNQRHLPLQLKAFASTTTFARTFIQTTLTPCMLKLHLSHKQNDAFAHTPRTG